MQREELKPFKYMRVPMLMPGDKHLRLDFKKSLEIWQPDDFLRVAPSDEFYVYSLRRPNSQNDRIWAHHRSDVAHLLTKPQLHSPTCVGFYLCFTEKRMIWDVKAEGMSWTGDYYRKILTDKVIPFLQHPANIHGGGDPMMPVKLLHDNASCHRAYATQDLLISYDIDFFPTRGKGRYPPRSPIFNAAEHMGGIVQQEAEELLEEEKAPMERATLIRVLETVLQSHERDVDLFRKLLRVLPKRLAMLEDSSGGDISYHT